MKDYKYDYKRSTGMLKKLQLSKSGYYEYLKRKPCKQKIREKLQNHKKESRRSIRIQKRNIWSS